MIRHVPRIAPTSPRVRRAFFVRSITLILSVLIVATGFPPFTHPLLTLTSAGADTTGTTRVSTDSLGDQANAESRYTDISDDGRFVSFTSSASNLVAGDTNGADDVFVHDTVGGTTTLVSANSNGVQGNGASRHPSISGDGRYVAFPSSASNLVPGDTNGGPDVFVKDAVTGATTLVSVAMDGSPAGSSGTPLAISKDGRYVAFGSGASNIVPGDTNTVEDLFLRDLQSNATARVSVSSNGGQGNLGGGGFVAGFYPAISATGRYIAFTSKATNLVPGDTNGKEDVFVRDVVEGQTTRVSVSSSGEEARSDISSAFPRSYDPAISPDGRYVAFTSEATNLVADDTNGFRDVFVHDMVLGTTERVSLLSGRQIENKDSEEPAVSAGGRYVAFSSGTRSIIGIQFHDWQTYVFDRTTGETTKVSVSSAGSQGNDDSLEAAISRDGRYVAFTSWSSNLVSGDTNSAADVFLRDRGASSPPSPVGAPPSVTSEQTWGSGSGEFADNPSALQADPVNGATGNYVLSLTDAALPGPGVPFLQARTYNSADPAGGPLGQGWTHSYSANLSVAGNGDVTIRAPDGQRVKYTVQPDGSYAGAPGAHAVLRAVDGGFELVRRDQVRYRFSADGLLTSMKDRNGVGLTLSYDAQARLTTVVDGGGRQTTYTHDPSGRLTQIDLLGGRTVRYSYMDSRLAAVADVRGATTTYQYDSAGRLAQVIDANGHSIVRNVYDAAGRVVEQLDPLGNRSTFAWDPTTQTSTMTDARGGVWKDVYSDNVLLRRIDPLGNTTRFDWDEKLNLAGVTDPRGNRVAMTYDGNRNLTRRVAPSPLSFEESYVYNGTNDLISATNGRGHTTTYEYDGAGNLIKVTDPSGGVNLFTHDPAKTLLLSATDPRGKTTAFHYDAEGNLDRITSPSGNVTTMSFDASGRLTSRVDPRGNAPGATPSDFRSSYAYDAAGNLVSVTDPLGNQMAWAYDAVGNRTSLTDAKNRTTTYAYDEANHLTSVTAPDGAATTYAYDPTGNLIRRTDANNHVTTYGYDAANRLTNLTDPLGRRWTYAYDPNGNRTGLVDAVGNQTPTSGDGTTTYTYDELNRLTRIDYSDATRDAQFAYDANGNRTTMTDAKGTETYTYDVLNRLTAVTRGTDSFSYQYDAAGSVTRRTYPDGTMIDYAYDDDGRLSAVTSGGAATTYSYDAASNPTSAVLPNDFTDSRTYDRSGRLTEVRNTKGSDTLSFDRRTYDQVGNPVSQVTTEGTTTFTYDAQDRLTEVCFAVGCNGVADPLAIRYGYDQVGNRTSESRFRGTTTYAYDVADQLLTTSGPAGTVTYAYDANGNQTQAGNQTFTYDRANRLATAGSTTYTYDGDGKRLEASSLGSKTRYLWDTIWSLPQLALERDGSGNLVRRYVHGNDLISMRSGGKDFYYHYDGLGSVSDLTSSTGAPQWSYSYEPFGASRSALPLDLSAPANPMRFTGQYLDATGLYHMRARQMDPTLGRFTTRDPIPPKIFAPCVSNYVYANNTPTSMIDPAGLEACQVERGGESPGAYWNIRSHMGFWDQQAAAGASSDNALVGFFQWGAGKVLGGALDISGLDTVQASAETWGTPCTGGYEKFMSAASIVGVGASWLPGGWVTIGGTGRLGLHEAHHTFRWVGPMRHWQFNIWRRGVKGSGYTFPRLPWPW